MGLCRIALPCLLLPALAGCLMFEQAPADLGCDADLAGRWVPLPGNEQSTMPLGRDDYVQVDAQCNVTLVDDKNMAQRPRFAARSFALDGERYIALNQAAMRQLFNDTQAPAKPAKLPAGSMLLVKYRIVSGVVELALPDISYVVDAVKDGSLKARETDSMVYLAQGDRTALRALIAAHPKLFESFSPESRNLRLRRASTEAAP